MVYCFHAGIAPSDGGLARLLVGPTLHFVVSVITLGLYHSSATRHLVSWLGGVSLLFVMLVSLSAQASLGSG